MNQVCTPFAEALRQGREDFNQRFARARRAGAELDGAEFSSFLLAGADPIVAAVAERFPEAVCETVSAIYDIALELAGQGLLNPRYAAVGELWRRHLPTAAHLIAAAPNQVIAAATNALHHLMNTQGARPDEWSTMMSRVAPMCTDAATFLRAGQVAAWRAGLAHYRVAALALADQLPAEIPAAIFALDHPDAWPVQREAFRDNPWHDPANGTSQSLRLAARVGAFRGFGGLFPEPPQVANADGRLLVRSGNGCWELTADTFGATFHRAPITEFESAVQRTLPPETTIRDGFIVRGKERLAIGDCGPVTSHAATSDTLSVTFLLTHAVLLIALR
jgi:hypothetical protein